MSLIIKVPDSVENEDLPILGALRMEVSNTSVKYFNLVNTDYSNSYAKIVGDGYFTDASGSNLGKSRAITSGWNSIYLSAGSYALYIGAKYGIEEIDSSASASKIEFDLSELKYDSSLKRLILVSTNVSGDISNISGKPVTNLNFTSSTGIEGDVGSISDTASTIVELVFSNLTKLTGDLSWVKNAASTIKTLKLEYTNNSDFSLKLEDVANLTLVRNLTLMRCSPNVTGSITSLGKIFLTSFGFPEESSITGTLEDLCDAMVANGRTSGTMKVYYIVSAMKTVTFSSSYERGWTVA